MNFVDFEFCQKNYPDLNFIHFCMFKPILAELFKCTVKPFYLLEIKNDKVCLYIILFTRNYKIIKYTSYISFYLLEIIK